MSYLAVLFARLALPQPRVFWCICHSSARCVVHTKRIRICTDGHLPVHVLPIAISIGVSSRDKLHAVCARLLALGYASLEDVLQDIEQIYINARIYNEESSPVVQDAQNCSDYVQVIIGYIAMQMHPAGRPRL